MCIDREMSWRETASTTATMTTTAAASACCGAVSTTTPTSATTTSNYEMLLGCVLRRMMGLLRLQRSKGLGSKRSVVGCGECGSGAGQGIHVTTNESTIVARSWLYIEMRRGPASATQAFRGRWIPRTRKWHDSG